MKQQCNVATKASLIVEISSSLITAIFDCGIYSTWQMNMYLMSTVKLSLVKFHNFISTKIAFSMTCFAIELFIDTYVKDIYRQNMR